MARGMDVDPPISPLARRALERATFLASLPWRPFGDSSASSDPSTPLTLSAPSAPLASSVPPAPAPSTDAAGGSTGSRPARPSRWFALGDPQAPAARVLEVLAVHGLLGEDGWLAPDVGLVSIGDHYDYRRDDGDLVTMGEDGSKILAWLASHAPSQVVVLAGNHDLCRVGELAMETDASFALVRERAAWVAEAPKGSDERRTRELTFRGEFPLFATPGLASRDYASFTVAQRDLVQRLLIAGRLRLGVVGYLADHTPLLLTHAGVSSRDLASMGVGDASADVVASALSATLQRAVSEVAPPWMRGELAPLSLAPLHVAGAHGMEGGGLLYHRPADTSRQGADPAWELRPAAPRRFHPRELPRGLVQACGHCNHEKCLTELSTWVTERAASMSAGTIRTLRTFPDRIEYDQGLLPPGSEATLYLIDGSILSTPPADLELLPLVHVVT